jgi:hypothetical protein
LREYADASATGKGAQERKIRAQSLIRAYLDRCGTETVEAGGCRVERRTHNRAKEWNSDLLREVLAPLGLWSRMTEATTSAVRKLVDPSELRRDQARAVEAAADHVESRQLRVKSVATGGGVPEESAE